MSTSFGLFRRRRGQPPSRFVREAMERREVAERELQRRRQQEEQGRDDQKREQA